MDKPVTVRGLTFEPFDMLQNPSRSPAPVKKDGVLIGRRKEAEGRLPERVVALNRDPEIQVILDAAHAVLLRLEREERKRRALEFSAESAARASREWRAARKALGLDEEGGEP